MFTIILQSFYNDFGNLFIYYVFFSLGTMEFMGHADLPQQAKHNASVQALPYLNQMPDIKPPSKAAAIPKNSQSKKETETASMTKEGKNVIMVLNEIAMQQQVCIDWNIVDEDGPPHMRAFTYTLKMGSYEVSFFLYLPFVWVFFKLYAYWNWLPNIWRILTYLSSLQNM